MNSTVARVIDFFRCLLTLRTSKTLMPKRVLKALVKQGIKDSYDWGADMKPEAPNYYAVFINPKDWDMYYGPHLEIVQRRFSELLSRELKRRQYLIEEPVTIELISDASQKHCQAYVKSSYITSDNSSESLYGGHHDNQYAAPSSLGHDAVDGHPKKENLRGILGNLKGEIASFIQCESAKLDVEHFTRSEDQLCTHPSSTEALDRLSCDETLKMPRKDTALLCVGSNKYLIHDGDSVGASKNGTSPVTVRLIEKGNDTVSAVHGVFSCGPTGWMFKNLGVNGTLVENAEGVVKHLGRGESHHIEDGFNLRFGTSSEYSFRTSSIPHAQQEDTEDTTIRLTV